MHGLNTSCKGDTISKKILNNKINKYLHDKIKTSDSNFIIDLEYSFYMIKTSY